MSVMERYLKYIGQIGSGERTMPENLPSAEGASMADSVLNLVKACAAQDGETISAEELAEFDPTQLEAAFAAMQAPAEPAPAEEAPEDENLPHIEEPDGPRNAYEVLLDCCLLDDGMFQYLIQTLKEHDGLGFFRLSQVTTKQDIRPEDFLYWLATKEQRADREEQVCVALMDLILHRLKDEGKLELLAALISGDQITFELFRCDCPELMHLPEATYDWFERNYLSRYYPVRLMLRLHGVPFPEVGA